MIYIIQGSMFNARIKTSHDNVDRHSDRVFENADQEPNSGEAKRRKENTYMLYITTDTNTLKKKKKKTY